MKETLDVVRMVYKKPSNSEIRSNSYFCGEHALLCRLAIKMHSGGPGNRFYSPVLRLVASVVFFKIKHDCFSISGRIPNAELRSSPNISRSYLEEPTTTEDEGSTTVGDFFGCVTAVPWKAYRLGVIDIRKCAKGWKHNWFVFQSSKVTRTTPSRPCPVPNPKFESARCKLFENIPVKRFFW